MLLESEDTVFQITTEFLLFFQEIVDFLKFLELPFDVALAHAEPSLGTVLKVVDNANSNNFLLVRENAGFH